MHSKSIARDHIRRHAPALELIKLEIARAARMIENPVVSTRVKKLTTRPILIQIDALRLAITIGHHFAQRRIFVGEVLTRIRAVLSNAALHLRVIETLFRLHIEQERILAQLHHQATINALEVAAAALRVDKTILVHVARTFRDTIRVDRPVADLLILSVVQTWLAQNHLVFAAVAEVIRRAVVRIGVEAGRVRRALYRAEVLLQQGERGRAVGLVLVGKIRVARARGRFLNQQAGTVGVERPHAIAVRLLP